MKTKAGWIALSVAVAAALTIGIWLHERRQAPAGKKEATISQPAGAIATRPPTPAEGTAPNAIAGVEPAEESKRLSRLVNCYIPDYKGTVPLSQVVQDATNNTVDVRAGMDCTFPVSDKLPPLSLHFVGRPDNTLGDIEVRQGDKLLQTITGREVDVNALYPALWDSELQSVDANFDGYQDLELLDDCGGTGNCDYSFYLYDPANQQFVYSKFLSNMETPTFDSAKKQVDTNWNSSAVDFGSSVYQFHDGKYVEIKRFESDEKETRTYERKDGKMMLTDTEKRDNQ